MASTRSRETSSAAPVEPPCLLEPLDDLGPSESTLAHRAVPPPSLARQPLRGFPSVTSETRRRPFPIIEGVPLGPSSKIPVSGVRLTRGARPGGPRGRRGRGSRPHPSVPPSCPCAHDGRATVGSG